MLGGPRTPSGHYRPLIQRILRERHGKASRQHVMREIEARVPLTRADWDPRPNGSQPEWQHRVDAVKEQLVDEGLVKPPEEAGWGTWELTELS